jgi:hypothetical protein
MNPRNSIWRDVPALNAYVARCQSVLQSGTPDNDLLLYWPICDFWQDPKGMLRPMTVHARDWFEEQAIGKTAEALWNRGYAFDYLSDKQLAGAKCEHKDIRVPGGTYRAVVVPPSRLMPLDMLQRLLALAKAGATVVFLGDLPADVPGWSNLEKRRADFKTQLAALKFSNAGQGTRQAKVGKGLVMVGEVQAALAAAGVRREPLFDHPGLMCIRRQSREGTSYFIANRGEEAIADWVNLSSPGKSAEILDPLSGRVGSVPVKASKQGQTGVYLQLQPGGSLIVRLSPGSKSALLPWTWWKPAGPSETLEVSWQAKFLEGGPELPPPFTTQRLGSWVDCGDTNAARFAGTAVYSTQFDAPGGAADHFELDLGRVAQSARVRLNGEDLGTLIVPPFRVAVASLKPKGNRLEVEVTNASANRIRDLDQRGVKWKTFHDINFVNLDYKPFDASGWPLTESGLLGPVRLTPVSALHLADAPQQKK